MAARRFDLIVGVSASSTLTLVPFVTAGVLADDGVLSAAGQKKPQFEVRNAIGRAASLTCASLPSG